MKHFDGVYIERSRNAQCDNSNAERVILTVSVWAESKTFVLCFWFVFKKQMLIRSRKPQPELSQFIIYFNLNRWTNFVRFERKSFFVCSHFLFMWKLSAKKIGSGRRKKLPKNLKLSFPLKILTLWILKKIIHY